MYVIHLQDFNGSKQLSATVHLAFYFNFWSLDLSLLLACFWGALYAMLLQKMEIISRVEPFDCIRTFLEVISLHGFSCVITACRFIEFDTFGNLPCAYTLFVLVSIVRYDLKYWLSRDKDQFFLYKHIAYLHSML